MKIETAFNCGDKGWVYHGNSFMELTIGSVEVTYRAPQHAERRLGTICVNDGDNYEYVEPSYEERYMCNETGIGSGSVYTLGKHIFTTREACESVNAEKVAEELALASAREIRNLKEMVGRENYLKSQLLAIDKAKTKLKELNV